VNKIIVADVQRRNNAIFGTFQWQLFAYNEAPTFAVANDCWFRARRYTTRPFFLSPLF
jgi:hypothetical protein